MWQNFVDKCLNVYVLLDLHTDKYRLNALYLREVWCRSNYSDGEQGRLSPDVISIELKMYT